MDIGRTGFTGVNPAAMFGGPAGGVAIPQRQQVNDTQALFNLNGPQLSPGVGTKLNRMSPASEGADNQPRLNLIA